MNGPWKDGTSILPRATSKYELRCFQDLGMSAHLPKRHTQVLQAANSRLQGLGVEWVGFVFGWPEIRA